MTTSMIVPGKLYETLPDTTVFAVPSHDPDGDGIYLRNGELLVAIADLDHDGSNMWSFLRSDGTVLLLGMWNHEAWLARVRG